jgi:hypothetical protein
MDPLRGIASVSEVPLLHRERRVLQLDRVADSVGHDDENIRKLAGAHPLAIDAKVRLRVGGADPLGDELLAGLVHERLEVVVRRAPVEMHEVITSGTPSSGEPRERTALDRTDEMASARKRRKAAASPGAMKRRGPAGSLRSRPKSWRRSPRSQNRR